MSGSVEIDYKKLTEKLRASSTQRIPPEYLERTANIVFDSIFHPEFKEFREFIDSASELDAPKRSELFSKIIKSISLAPRSLASFDLKDEDYKLPITDKAKEFLDIAASVSAGQRQITTPLAAAALSLSDFKKDKDEVEQEFKEKYGEWEKLYSTEVARDVPRHASKIVFTQGKNRYQLDLSAEEIPSVPYKLTFEVFKSKLLELSEEKGLGLNGAQMDVIMRSSDQASMISGGKFKSTFAAASKGALAGETYVPIVGHKVGNPSMDTEVGEDANQDAGTVQVDISDDGEVIVSSSRIDEIYVAETKERLGSVVNFSRVDISGIEGESLPPGMGKDVKATLSISQTEGVDLDIDFPEGTKTEEMANAIKLYIDQKIAGRDLKDKSQREEIFESVPDTLVGNFLSAISKKAELTAEERKALMDKAFDRTFTSKQFEQTISTLSNNGFKIDPEDIKTLRSSNNKKLLEDFKNKKISGNVLSLDVIKSQEAQENPGINDSLKKALHSRNGKIKDKTTRYINDCKRGGKNVDIGKLAKEIKKQYPDYDEYKLKRYARDMSDVKEASTNMTVGERVQFFLSDVADYWAGRQNLSERVSGIKTTPTFFQRVTFTSNQVGSAIGRVFSRNRETEIAPVREPVIDATRDLRVEPAVDTPSSRSITRETGSHDLLADAAAIEGASPSTRPRSNARVSAEELHLDRRVRSASNTSTVSDISSASLESSSSTASDASSISHTDAPKYTSREGIEEAVTSLNLSGITNAEIKSLSASLHSLAKESKKTTKTSLLKGEIQKFIGKLGESDSKDQLPKVMNIIKKVAEEGRSTAIKNDIRGISESKTSETLSPPSTPPVDKKHGRGIER